LIALFTSQMARSDFAFREKSLLPSLNPARIETPFRKLSLIQPVYRLHLSIEVEARWDPWAAVDRRVKTSTRIHGLLRHEIQR